MTALATRTVHTDPATRLHCEQRDVALLAMERGYLEPLELITGLERWERHGCRGALLELLVEDGALLSWQATEVEAWVVDMQAPPLDWEELGVGD